MCNKSLTIKDFVVENDFDIFAITETWLSPVTLMVLLLTTLFQMATPLSTLLVRVEEAELVSCLRNPPLDVKQESINYLGRFTSFDAMEMQIEVFSQLICILVV